MSKRPQWWESLKKAPAWISGAISFVTAVIGFVLLLQGNVSLGVTILSWIAVIFSLGLCLYLIFARTPPLVEGGKGVFRYEKYRLWAISGVGLVLVLVATAAIIKPDSVVCIFTTNCPPTNIATPTNGPPPCTPLPFSELPPETTAVIEPLKSKGAVAKAPYISLRYEHMSGLRLASGVMVEFKKMRRFELFNPGFNTDFAADVVITFLDCTTLEDRIQSESGSNLTADTEFGPLELHILDVQQVDFQW